MLKIKHIKCKGKVYYREIGILYFFLPLDLDFVFDNPTFTKFIF